LQKGTSAAMNKVYEQGTYVGLRIPVSLALERKTILAALPAPPHEKGVSAPSLANFCLRI